MEDLRTGRIYTKDEVWFVIADKEKLPIRKEDAKNLVFPISCGKETCFEEIDGYVKLWSTCKMVRDLQYYLENTPQEQINEDWEKSKIYDEVEENVAEHDEVISFRGKYNFLNNEDFALLKEKISPNDDSNIIIIGTDVYIKYLGDLSDLGNDLGRIVGYQIDDDKRGYDKDAFLYGIKHGISIIDGTHG